MGIFCSSQKLHFHAPVDRLVLIEAFQKKYEKPSVGARFAVAFGGKPKYFGKVIDNQRIEIERLTHVRNSFRPLMVIDLDPVHGGTAVNTHFYVTAAARLFMVIWMAIAISISVVIAVSSPQQLPFVGLFPLWGLIILVACRLFGRADERALIELVQNVMTKVGCDRIAAEPSDSHIIDVSVRAKQKEL